MIRFFSLRQLLLTFVAIFAILFMAHLKRYSEWSGKLSDFWDEYEEKKDSLGIDTRLQYYGYTYDICKIIKKQIDTGNHRAVVVFPPREYFTKNNISFTPPEPSVFYYFTGMRAMWMNNPQAPKATHWVEVSNTELRITPIKSPEEFTRLTAPYKNYQL